MDICTILAMFLTMYQAHMDIPANQLRLAEGGKYLQQQCDDSKRAEEKKAKKVGGEKVKPKGG